MTAYYNEIDPFAASWLRSLIKAGHIAHGYVDERSIEDVTANDLDGFTQCHFFAGIGVWSHALPGAGWQDDRPVWTGSCPCQPFSSAGKKAGFADDRHLWPEWFRLISQCRPDAIFGEQVAGPSGSAWLDAVQTDLDDADYTTGALDLCAAGFGAPHLRQRLYFVAHPLGHASGERCQENRPNIERPAQRASRSGAASATNGFWERAQWLEFDAGATRPVEPSTFPLAYEPAQRVGRLRGYGNAIVAEVAKHFIGAYMSHKEEQYFPDGGFCWQPHLGLM